MLSFSSRLFCGIVRLRKSQGLPPQPDWPIGKVFNQLVYDSRWGVAKPISGETVFDAEVALRDAARLGLIQIWGREFHWEIPLAMYSIEPIPKEYWASADFNMTYCFLGNGGRTRPREKGIKTFHDLFANKSQINERWPSASLWRGKWRMMKKRRSVSKEPTVEEN